MKCSKHGILMSICAECHYQEVADLRATLEANATAYDIANNAYKHALADLRAEVERLKQERDELRKFIDGAWGCFMSRTCQCKEYPISAPCIKCRWDAPKRREGE